MEKNMLEQIYKKYAKDAFLYTYSLCQNKSLAEDIVSDAFFKALLSLTDSHSNVKAWIFQVCRNCWIDYVRKNKRRVDLDNQVLQSQTDDKAETSHLFFEKERNRQLYQAILKLPTSYREAITLFYFANLSQTEIALILQKNEGTIRILIYRAKIKLKQTLQNDWEGV